MPLRFRAPATAGRFPHGMMVPGRPYGLHEEAERILRESRVPTPASVSDRLRAKKQFHASWSADMEKRLDAIDAIEAKALPLIEREMHEREMSAQALENDALAMQKMAEDTERANGGPTTAPVSSLNGSGAGSADK